MAVTCLADAPGVVLGFIFLLVMGRKMCMAVQTATFATCLLLANLCMGRLGLNFLIFIARAFINGAYQTAFIYSNESHPTQIRAVGLGMASASSRVGAIITPYIAQVVTGYSAFISFSVYGIVGLLGTVLSFLLPFDTRGKPMVESGH